MIYKYNIASMMIVPQYILAISRTFSSAFFSACITAHITFLCVHRWNGTLEVFLRVVNLHSLTLWPKCVAVHKRAWQRRRLK